MSEGFAARLRWGLLVGLCVAGTLMAKDILFGEWQGFDSVRVVTLTLSIFITAFLWAWLAGRFGRRDDA